MNLRRLFLYGLMAISKMMHAQLHDDFSKGNILENPLWEGDVDEFFVNADLQLQSNADSISTFPRKIYIVTESKVLHETQWDFFANPKLSTSSNNLIDAFLVSDEMNLTGELHGYFVRIGGTPDEVAFFRKDGAMETKIISGKSGSINGSTNNPTRVRVTRDSIGYWTLFADYDGTGNNFEWVGNSIDTTYSKTSWFGVVVKYSNSNRLKFFLDDIHVAPVYKDKTPPLIKEMHVLRGNELQLVFSEAMDDSSVQDTLNYLMLNNNVRPSIIQKNLQVENAFNLFFPKEFLQGKSLKLNISGVHDKVGNIIADTQIVFVYYHAKPYDIVINEIMADPDPPAGPPVAEYIELYNRTAFPVNLSGWKLKSGSNTKQLPAATIQPDSFLVLTSFQGASLFHQIIPIAPVVAMPALMNTGAELTLLDEQENVISYVFYRDDWYQDEIKKQGGWSLEQISTLMPCSGKINWTASTSPSGGTPGSRNSANRIIMDQTNPKIERVAILSPDTIQLFFSESVQDTITANPLYYHINEGIGSPLMVMVSPPSFSSVKLLLKKELQLGQVYTIRMNKQAKDCSGNLLDSGSTAIFAMPVSASSGDIIINEILFNPRNGGYDYVELYNRSQKTIDLHTLKIGSVNPDASSISENYPIVPSEYLLFPGQFILLTINPEQVIAFYSTNDPNAFIKMQGMAPYSNDSGIVVLSRLSDQKIIDQVTYSEKMHYSLLKNFDGISLERIHHDRPSDDLTNWNSASSLVNYGTPGLKNSQFNALIDNPQSSLTIEPELFSPDGDGINDIVDMAYAFDESGYTGSLTIFDLDGLPVRYLVRNKLLGTSGQFSWNGINEENTLSPIGIYIAFMEAFTLDGKMVRRKKTFVLGGNF